MKKFVFCTVIALALLMVSGTLGCKGFAPTQAIEHYNKGVALEDEGRYDEAIAEYNKAIEINRNYTNAYSNRGHAYFKKKQYDLAITDYTRAIQLDPKHTISYNGRGSAYINIKKYKLAALDFNKAIELDPNFSQAHTNRDIVTKMLTQASEYNRQGVTLASTGKNDEAIVSFSKAIQVYPNYPSAYTNRGIVYIIKKQYDLAITDFNSAIKLNSNYALAYSNRGLAYIYTERYKEAVADLDKSLQIDPQDDNAWNNRGVALEQMGDIAGAIDSYDTAFKLDPSNENANNNRQVLQSGGRPPGVNPNAWGSIYRPTYETAWEGTTESPVTTTEPPDDTTPVGGVGIQIKTLTGEWINDSPRYGLVMNDGGSKWNYDVVLKLVETDPNTGGLHVQQPNTFTGTMQTTLRSITGPATTVPELMSMIGQTLVYTVSGTRDGSIVKLNFGGKILRLTFNGDYLYGDTNFYDAGRGLTEVRPSTGSYITWTWSIYLKRK